MSRQAQALLDAIGILEEAGTTVDAKVTVTAAGGDDLVFTTSDPAVKIAGKQIFLQPASSGEQPVFYNLTFEAGTGVERFQTPAATFGREEKKGTFAVNPLNAGQEFLLSFVNDLPPLAVKTVFEFLVHWEPSGGAWLKRSQKKLGRSTDPTIILDPPNS
jgi:hypothetical protein